MAILESEWTHNCVYRHSFDRTAENLSRMSARVHLDSTECGPAFTIQMIFMTGGTSGGEGNYWGEKGRGRNEVKALGRHLPDNLGVEVF